MNNGRIIAVLLALLVVIETLSGDWSSGSDEAPVSGLAVAIAMKADATLAELMPAEQAIRKERWFLAERRERNQQGEASRPTRPYGCFSHDGSHVPCASQFFIV